jgi:hypothetical protein
MASKTNTPENAIDVATLHMTDEPYSDGRDAMRTKYDDFFATVTPNRRIVCPSGKAGGLAASLRKWLTKRGHQGVVVKARERCDDSHGGVWWVQEAK